MNPKDMKRAMPFISMLKQRLATESTDAVFNRELPFDEVATIKATIENVKKCSQAVKCEEFQFISFPHGSKVGKDIFTGEQVDVPNSVKIVENAVPGAPGIIISNI